MIFSEIIIQVQNLMSQRETLNRSRIWIRRWLFNLICFELKKNTLKINYISIAVMCDQEESKTA